MADLASHSKAQAGAAATLWNSASRQQKERRTLGSHSSNLDTAFIDQSQWLTFVRALTSASYVALPAGGQEHNPPTRRGGSWG